MDNKDFHDICVECKLDFKAVSNVLFEKIKELESRTCENCKYHKFEYGMFLCNYHEIDYYNPVYGKFTGKDYGCPKFKREQDETNQ